MSASEPQPREWTRNDPQRRTAKQVGIARRCHARSTSFSNCAAVRTRSVLPSTPPLAMRARNAPAAAFPGSISSTRANVCAANRGSPARNCARPRATSSATSSPTATGPG